jgi:hypothetical protein
MTEERRNTDRRRTARHPLADSAPTGRSLVLVDPPVATPASETSADLRSRRTAAAFAAQVMGQSGQKRGLRGGPETLDKARATYLVTEWSGPADRRPHPGRITKTEI